MQKLSGAIQEALLALICYDKAGRTIQSLLPAPIFDPYYRDIAAEAYQYLSKYNQPPSEHTLDIIESLVARRPDAKQVFERLFESLQATRQGINSEYVLQQAAEFARRQRLKAGIARAVEVLEQDEQNVAEAEASLRAAVEGSYELFNPGIVLTDAKRSLAFLDNVSDGLATGIPEFDRLGIGPGRKELHVFVAPPGRGKSWWLISQLGKRALLTRQRVVHVTLEMSEEQVCQRYMQALFSFQKRREDTTQYRFRRDELGRLASFDPEVVSGRPALTDASIRDFLTQSLDKISSRPPILVKQFPTGALTVPELEAYLDSLEGSLHIIPDLLIVDYADLMKTTTNNYRHDLGALYRDLRGLAIKRNLRVVTASQSNRDGAGAKQISDRHIAEDYSKVATADCIISYSQTDAEKQLNLARLFVMKCRADQDKFTVLISQNYALGQFCMDSIGMVSDYWDLLDSQTAADDSDADD
jgi:replicative DNA helicase